MGKMKKGTWVEVHNILLHPEKRSSRLPDDSKKVPYEMRARGFLLTDASLNEEVEIETLSGRIITGKLSQQEPGYTHGYGPPIVELVNIGEEEKKLLENKI